MTSAARASLAHDLDAFSRAQLGASLSLSCGIPHAPPWSEARPRGQGLWLELEATREPRRVAALWIDAQLACDVVDRALGGEGVDAPAAHAASRLDEPEQGVLAYAVARGLAALDVGLRLVGVASEEPPPWVAQGRGLCWPCEAALDGRRGAVRAWFESGEDAPPWSLQAAWVAGAEPWSPETLGTGDVIRLETPPPHVFDGWLWLTAPDLHLPVRATPQGLVRRPGAGAPPGRDLVRLEVPLPALSFAALHELLADRPLPLDTAAPWPARLCLAGGCLAEGELVLQAGHLGLRVRTAAAPFDGKPG